MPFAFTANNFKATHLRGFFLCHIELVNRTPIVSPVKPRNDRGEEKNTGMTRKVLVMFRLDPGIFLMDCQINFGNDNIIFFMLDLLYRCFFCRK